MSFKILVVITAVLLGTVASAVVPGLMRNESVPEKAVYTLSTLDPHKENLTNETLTALPNRWRFLEYIRHPSSSATVIYEASKTHINKLMENRDSYIYLPALIGVASAFLTLLLLVFLKSIFNRSRSLLRRFRVKRMHNQLDDNMKLIQPKSKDDSTDTILL